MTISQTVFDVIDRVAIPTDPVAAQTIRQHRVKISGFIQTAYDAIFVDSSTVMDIALRLTSATQVATLTGEPDLATFYDDELRRYTCGRVGAASDAQRAAVAAHVKRVTLAPETCDRAALDALRSAGVSTEDIVTLSQLIGYVAFQARVIAGVRAIAGVEKSPVALDTPVALVRHDGFTTDSLDWASWLMPVDVASATPEQLEILDESGPIARKSAYYLTLIHDADVLRQRSAAYNAIMYAPGGLDRADRELGALVVSTLNGCSYCASVHAQRLIQLSKRAELVRAVFTDPMSAGESDPDRALILYAQRLTLYANEFSTADVERLRAVGLSDGEILDFTHAVAIFGWANRLMQTLGEPVHRQAKSGQESASRGDGADRA
ncbi:peroxidase-related enzyme [Burkholderia sp. L27(2015)]|uniref:CMD domain-containing protein n=1 Tax=Burkholderia sp. L27(2015) TaxID=1641858 RepID=UPI00131B1723|nr:peroxidase-related enzyme [Burkholderia sp. L27(2015)]